jgi:hypothetical protein
LKKVERKCYTLTLAPFYLDFKLKSKWIWLILKMDPGPDPRENLFRPGPRSGHARSSLVIVYLYKKKAGFSCYLISHYKSCLDRKYRIAQCLEVEDVTVIEYITKERSDLTSYKTERSKIIDIVLLSVTFVARINLSRMETLFFLINLFKQVINQ